MRALLYIALMFSLSACQVLPHVIGLAHYYGLESDTFDYPCDGYIESGERVKTMGVALTLPDAKCWRVTKVKSISLTNYASRIKQTGEKIDIFVSRYKTPSDSITKEKFYEVVKDKYSNISIPVNHKMIMSNYEIYKGKPEICVAHQDYKEEYGASPEVGAKNVLIKIYDSHRLSCIHPYIPFVWMSVSIVRRSTSLVVSSGEFNSMITPLFESVTFSEL